eukprot:bmy_16153T0
MDYTLEENGIWDEEEEFDYLNMDSTLYTPARCKDSVLCVQIPFWLKNGEGECILEGSVLPGAMQYHSNH